MNKKTLNVLEFPKIKEMLKSMATCTLGKDLVDNLEPATNIDEVKTMQEETAEATSLILRRGNPNLGGIHDLLMYLKRAEIGSSLYAGQLLEVCDTLRAARRIRSFIREAGEDNTYDRLSGYTSALNTFKYMEDKIDMCIIGENQISDNASPTLKHIRREIENKNGTIRSRLNSMISSTSKQKYLQDSIITMRDDRYVIPVKQEYRANVPGLIHDQSSSGATLFIEPMAIVELNNKLKELKLQEKSEIERILLELTLMVAEKKDEILANQEILKKLDFIFAKGKLAVHMNAIEPKVNDYGFIRIKNGRHPLLDKDTVVPSNIWIGDEFNTLVITGPNTGGKTVTLKTVGLLTIMTQCGLHVPAQYGTRMSVFKQVFADIGDEQSIEQSLSTFSGHMSNIVDILDHVEENALVLLDELGAGTDPTEGAALAISILDYLAGFKSKTIATTHYTEIKEYALTTDLVENASVEFDVQTLSPTYKLLIGVPGKSNAFEISKRLGLSDFIVDRARGLLTKENIEFEEILQTIEKDKRVAQEERDEASRLKIQIEKEKEQFESKKEKLKHQRETVLREARQEARKLLKEAKEEADNIIKELRDLHHAQSEKDKNRKIEEMRKKLRTSLNGLEDGLDLNMELSNLTPKDIKVGDDVIILSLNQQGTVLTKPDSNGDLTVQAGIMKINVNVKNLKKDKNKKKSVKKSGIGKIYKSKKSNVKTSLDLRGQSLEDALVETDKYLDDAYIANLTEVTIIHGKGTGILRAGITQLLKKHKHVDKFRIGGFSEGGSGATIVTLK
ncbi:MAG: endonuclease MutS2 [Anaeromicrobium sp.]|jgi:DNA mismatch repair protein MutS2|uniref:endonuclease MutS2 n=1 Tax=Anaeromicrobium sp. TaxID=1929132 RepID=UPI0025D76494|nr:endonuclease MutS2 [Anaeromicrobium sp.]MCT4594086.1 endonuclease MutS2 [Anaeromicrobium sp.]